MIRFEPYGPGLIDYPFFTDEQAEAIQATQLGSG